MRILFLLTATILSFHVTQAQDSDKEQAVAKTKEAITLMDEGKLTESVTLLNEARKLDPEAMEIVYELALAKYQLKDYNGAMKDLKYLVKQKAVTGKVYTMMGNVQDDMGKPEKAIATYNEGIKLFPQEGGLYVERGIMELKKGNRGKALEYFEQGVQHAPMHPSNYYRAAKLYLDSHDEVWGMIFGEYFMNLERGSKRTEEISKLMYYTYKGEIRFESDTATIVSFANDNRTILIDPGMTKKAQASDLAAQLVSLVSGGSYGTGVYEPTLALAVVGEKAINLPALHRIRTKFIDLYHEKGFDTTYAVGIFDFQRKLQDAGHLEAYNYWVLGQGDYEVFREWVAGNSQQWDAFIKWFKENRLTIADNEGFSKLGLTIRSAVMKGEAVIK